MENRISSLLTLVRRDTGNGVRVESACEGEGECIHVGVPESGAQVCSLPCVPLGPSLTNSSR